MNTSSFDAGGAPFSMLDAMNTTKQLGGNESRLKYYGGSKTAKKEYKVVMEAWKCFKLDTKSVKEPVLKSRIRYAENILKRRIGGASDDEPKGEGEGENEGEPKSVQENGDNYSEVVSQLDGLKNKVTELEAGLAVIQSKLVLDGDDNDAVKKALEIITTFINNKIDTVEQAGGRKYKKKFGGTSGQYAINDIYAKEVGNGITVGGKRFKNKGGEYAQVLPDTSSYNILDAKHGGNGNIISNPIANPLGDLRNILSKNGGKKSKKKGGNKDMLENPLGDLQNMLSKTGGNKDMLENMLSKTGGNKDMLENPLGDLQNMLSKTGGKKSKKKGGNKDMLENPLGDLQNMLSKTGGKKSKKKGGNKDMLENPLGDLQNMLSKTGGNLGFPGQLDSVSNLDKINEVVTSAGSGPASSVSHDSNLSNTTATHTSLGGGRRKNK